MGRFGFPNHLLRFAEQNGTISAECGPKPPPVHYLCHRELEGFSPHRVFGFVTSYLTKQYQR